MIELSNIHPLTDFVRNAKVHAARIKETKKPEILTINGRPELVVQDATTYEAMVNELEKARLIAAILEGERDIAEGRTRPAEEVFAEMKLKYGF
jgi:PHD/YefM family antitoxin component YafN of YafNO toxin-antitoxin module